jgi:hypothetical protein
VEVNKPVGPTQDNLVTDELVDVLAKASSDHYAFCDEPQAEDCMSCRAVLSRSRKGLEAVVREIERRVRRECAAETRYLADHRAVRTPRPGDDLDRYLEDRLKDPVFRAAYVAAAGCTCSPESMGEPDCRSDCPAHSARTAHADDNPTRTGR